MRHPRHLCCYNPKSNLHYKVWCELSSDPDYDGWTLILSDKYDGAAFNLENNNPLPYDVTTNKKFFIGLDNLAALTWSSGDEYNLTPRPLVARFRMHTAASPLVLYHATFDEFVINNDDNYNLVSVGNYHGNATNAFNDSVGEEFRKTSPHGWGPHFKLSVGNGHVVWGSRSLNYLYVTVRPKEFDKNLTCPPVVAYEYYWDQTTVVDFPLERKEGTIISYYCNGLGFMEGHIDDPMEEKHYSGNATCLNVDGQYNWSYVPIFPCTFSCPSTYEKLERNVCLRFSNDTTEFGISSASLRCSIDGASLAMPIAPNELNKSTEGNFYYTAYASKVPYTLSTENLYTCDADSLGSDCKFDTGERCLTLSKHNSTTYIRRSQDCKRETYYACQWPEHCPTGFFPNNGLCYKLINSKATFIDVLRDCEKDGSALAYPETVEELQYLNYLYRIHNGKTMDYPAVAGSVKIMIGLNSIYEDWSSGYDYYPEEDLLARAGERNLSRPYRYAVLPASVNENVTLRAQDNLVDSSASISLAACQLYGPRGCWSDPPNASQYMVMEWDGELKLDAVATYKCLLGYFMNYSLSITEQVATCRGQLGGWVVTENEYYNCSLMEVCDFDQVVYVNSSFMNITESEDFLTYNSSVQFTCPPFKAMPGGATEQTSTCVYHESSSLYGFDPITIPSCSVCTQNISIDNATYPWTTGTEIIENGEVTVTCDDGFMIRYDNDSASRDIVLKCDVPGWDIDPDDIQCLPVCSDPPEGGVNITVNVTSLFVGTNLTYVCDEGMYIPATFPNTVNYTEVTCEEDRMWNISLGLNETDLYCAEICFDDPITSSVIETSWDNVTRTVGTKVNLTCPDEHFLPDLSTNISVTCEPGGQWTNLTEDDILCRRVCSNPPESGVNMTINVTSLFVGTTLTYVCEEGMYIPATFPNTVNYTEVTCEEDRMWNISMGLNETDLYCAEICLDNPITSPLMETTWDNVTRTVGTQVNLTCPDEFFLPDFSTNISVTCEPGGQWTNLTETDVLCRRYTETLPTPPNGTMHGFPPGPYWEGMAINFTCLDNHTSPSRENMTPITFNGTDWVPLDPDFLCLYGCGEPIPADPPATMNFTGIGVVGDVASYLCPVGFEGTDLTNLTSTCVGGDWTLTEIPLCNMCEAPVRPPKYVDLIPDGDAFRYGEIVTYRCRGEYINGAKELESTCVDGEWDVQKVLPCYWEMPESKNG
ncbi:uncharacterized protein [Palaemon carinicauda]|uniref:uncharacterized protein n=1 Tax=Palaemon carinicauda TaxID=392227 RepID=UPI0035B6A213